MGVIALPEGHPLYLVRYVLRSLSCFSPSLVVLTNPTLGTLRSLCFNYAGGQESEITSGV